MADWNVSLAELDHLALRAVPGARVTFGESHGTNNGETPEAVHIMNIRAYRVEGVYGEKIEEKPVDLQFSLTVNQMAQIVIHFFWDVIMEKSVFSKFFWRVMSRRRKLATRQEYLEESEYFDGSSLAYHKISILGWEPSEEAVEI